MASEEIALLSKTIRSSMGDAAGEFRKASSSSMAMSRIIKDISNVFNAQRRDIAELSNTIADSAYEAEQTSSKMDHLSSLFREMISIQSNMQGTMREVSMGIRSVDNSLFSLNTNLSSVMNSGFSGLQGSFLSVGDSIISKLSTMAIGAIGGAVGGAIGAAGYDAVTSPSGGGGGGGGGGSTGPAVPFSGPNKPILDTIKMRESGNNYGKQNPSASASGAYQFIDSTWQSWARKAGVDVNQYPKAKLAPPEIQDKVADLYVSDILKRHGGDVTWVPREWYAGPDGQISASELQKNHGLTVDRYVSNWMSSFSKHSGGSQKTNEKSSTPSTAAATPQSTPMSSGATESSSGATPQSAPMSSGTTGPSPQTQPSGGMSPESMAGHGHGPISGPLSEASKVSASLPSGDIVALGRSLEKMGIKVSEHPAFGGVHPEKHYPNSAHNDGMALDINAPGGIVEANDPVWGKKFDEIARQIQAAGYTVLWRTRGHDNHIHAQIGGKGIRGGHSVIGGSAGAEHTTDKPSPTGVSEAAQPVSQVSTPSVTPAAVAAPATIASTTESQAAQPVQQPMVTPNVSSSDQSQTAPMAEAAPQVVSQEFLSSLAAYNQQNQQESPAKTAEMVDNVSKLALNNQTVSQTAVSQQAQQELAQQQTGQPQSTALSGSSIPSVSSMGGGGESYGYNFPWDTAWPDWAGMIGGLHWNEMKNFKKNMWA